MPDDLQVALRAMSRAAIMECEVRRPPPKHKYVCLRGRDRRETRALHREFEKRNPRLWARRFDYPQDRGR